jgi:DNA-binding response OmpR family regulator
MRIALSPRHHVPQLAPRVLLVEDDAAVRDALLGLLTLAGFETLAATSVAGAVEQLSFRPDIVLTDISLPDGTGADLLRRVRRYDETVAVAVMTAPDDELFAEVRGRRPDAVFRRPFDIADLMNWMSDPHPRACAAMATPRAGAD